MKPVQDWINKYKINLLLAPFEQLSVKYFSIFQVISKIGRYYTNAQKQYIFIPQGPGTGMTVIPTIL